MSAPGHPVILTQQGGHDGTVEIIEGATLRQIIMQKCNREFKLREKMLNDDPEHLRGFILFLAELFQQLEIQVKCCFL